MKIKLVFCSLIFVICSASSFAATETEISKKGNELEKATCAGIIDLFVAADPKINKQKKARTAAQDHTYVFVMWVHGYLNGRDGINFKSRPLNQAGITQLVGDIYEICKVDEGKLFLDAIRDIR